MSADEISELARKAGLFGRFMYEHKDEIETFAKLVAAKEREACAKVCDELQDVPATEPRHCAEDIRARGERA